MSCCPSLLSFVVALAGVPFGVLVRQVRAGGFEHGAGRIVLARDQAQLDRLADLFFFDEASDVGVTFSERRVEELRRRHEVAETTARYRSAPHQDKAR
jgi:hypothetical protein